MSQAKKAQINYLLSERLRNARTRLGLTQQGLAALTGFSLSAIGNWESRQNIPGPAKLGVLASRLGVSIDYLLGHEDAAAGRSPALEIRQVPIVSWTRRGMNSRRRPAVTRIVLR